MRVSDLLRSLDLGSAFNPKKALQVVDTSLMRLKEALQNKLTFGDNLQCDVITGQFDSGMPRTVALKHIRTARSALIFGSSVPGFGYPIVKMSGESAVVTLFFAQGAKNVTATVVLFDFGTPGGLGALVPNTTQPGLVYADGTTITQAPDGKLSVPPNGAYTAVTGNYTATSSDFDMVVTSLTANLAITLPSAAGAGAGRAYYFKDGTGTAGTGYIIKIAADGSDVIDGASAIVIFDDYGECRLVSNGSNAWYIASGVEHVGVDPRALTGLKAWYDIERGITTNPAAGQGYLVTGWVDQSGNGLDLAVHDNSPRLHIGGRRRNMHFQDFTSLKSSNTSFSGGGVTVYIVVAQETWEGAAWRSPVSQAFSATVGTKGWTFLKNGGAIHAILFTENFNVTSAAGTWGETVSNNAFLPVYSKQLLSGRLGASPVPTLQLSGRTFRNITGTVTAALPVTDSKPIFIGQSNKGGVNNDYWHGGIADVVLFDAEHTDAQMALMNAHLMRKHNFGFA